MIQDINPHKLNNQYDVNARPKDTDKVISIDGDLMLVSAKDYGDNILKFPAVAQVKDAQYTYLFDIDGIGYYKTCVPAFEGFEYHHHKEIRRGDLAPDFEIYAAMTAKHLSDWYRDNTFCGRCGARSEHSETERAKVCPECGYTCYPRIMPAVIVGVTNGDRIVLTRYRVGYGHNALVAGFAEIGETIEETVAREVMEETGLKVKNIRYYKSQPWGVANDLLFGFYCDVDGDDTIHMDEGELKYAEWTKREDIVLQPDNFSLTNEMMRMFMEGKE